LCGAGVVTFALALKRPTVNLGWSATLACGFLLGICSALEAVNTTLPAILCLAVLALGLPLLNVSFVTLRAKLRGESVEWNQQRFRLDEALAFRGVPPRKIATLYFVMGLWGCWLAYLAAHWFFKPQQNAVWFVLYALVWLSFLVGGGFLFFSLARVQMRRRAGENIPERLEAFGIEISPVSMTEALDKIEGFIKSGKPHHVVTSDANAVLTSRSDPEYTGIIRRAALITPDGFGLVWGARLLGLPIYERVTGVDMVTGICERAKSNGYRLYILGSEEGVASTAARNLSQKYPGATFVGTHHGFWRRDGKANGLTVEQADAAMADEIRRATPDVLFVAMGIPSQEKFIAAQLERMNVPVCIGVGGSFDVYSGKFNRAPLTVQRLGMEWLYRVWIDPSRWKRMGYVPKFMLVAVKTWILGDKKAADVY
jgi:N-acetylglucosaminyldiphosphoundecaprenol N-acetyl-beta-D-mannosaminyltransferase